MVKEGISVVGVAGSSYSIIHEMAVGVERIGEGVQSMLFQLGGTDFGEGDSERRAHDSTRGLFVELSIEFKVGVIQAEEKKSPHSLRCEGRRKEVRLFLKSRDGGIHSSVHITVGVERDNIQREVVGVGRSVGSREVLDEGVRILEANGGRGQRFEDVREGFVKGRERTVVEGNYRSDGCARFVDFRLAIELRISRVGQAHTGA